MVVATGSVGTSGSATTIGTGTEVPPGPVTVRVCGPLTPSGIVIVTVARPCSSVVSTTAGSIAAVPSDTSPSSTSAEPAVGPPLLNTSDERVSVTCSPTAYA